jgi:Ca2+-binding RTX toxin-like protein
MSDTSNPSSLSFTVAELPTDGKAIASTLGDFNNDGNLDLVVPLRNALSKNLAVFLGDGKSGFGLAVLSEAGGANGVAIAAEDFNGDGNLDVAIAQADADQVVIRLGNGDGTFRSGQTLNVGDQPNAIALGDINKDGKVDLAVANFGTTSVSILLGKGNGEFQSSSVTVGDRVQPYSVALGDLNKDGNLDLITADSYTDSVTVLLGKGDGGFRSPKSYSVGAVGVTPTGIATGDFNNDGKLDVVVSNVSRSAQNVSVLIGDGEGAFKSRMDLPTTGTALSVQTADFNGDGHLDIVTPDFSVGLTTVWLGDGKGTFPARVQNTVGVEPSSVALGDIDNDKKLDLVAINSGGSNAAVLVNQVNLVLLKSFSDNTGEVDGSKETRAGMDVDLSRGHLKVKSSPQLTGTIEGYTNVKGTSHKDNIIGNRDANVLSGNDGNDRISGLAGDDIISGGQGKDILSGGEGKDRFVFDHNRAFQSKDGADRILDFNHRQDLIVLDRGTFTTIRKKVNFAQAGSIAEAETSTAQVVYVRSKGRLFYNENGAIGGFGEGGLLAILKNPNSAGNLTAANFVTQR